MKSFKEFLSESISNIVFHKSSLNGVLNILNDNQFKLSTNLGTSSDQKSSKFFYISFARSPLSGYFKDPWTGNVYIELDGDKFNQRYSGQPVDYWGPEFKKVDPKINEMEDRIISDEQYIPNAISYIKAIHILPQFTRIKRDYFSDEETIEEIKTSPLGYGLIKQIYIKSKKEGIPVYIYNDRNAFLHRDNRKTISIKDVLGNAESQKNRFRPDRNPFSVWLELYYKKNKSELSDDAKKLRNNLNYDDYSVNLINTIHNNKSSSHLNKLVSVMKKEGFREIPEFYKFIKDKWKNK